MFSYLVSLYIYLLLNLVIIHSFHRCPIGVHLGIYLLEMTACEPISLTHSIPPNSQYYIVNIPCDKLGPTKLFT